jgi:3-hydroxyacyl-CoA dehydrogenase
VVAAPFGLALGSGCEISLAADRIVAHAELYMGLVEVGVGLLPSLGGCTNLWKKYIRNIPQSITDMDWGKYFVPVFMTIGLAKVSTSAADARANGFLGPRDRIVFNRDHLIAEAKKEVLKMVSDGYVPPVKRPVPVVGEAGQGMIGAELYNMQKAGFISDYDVHLAQRIAFVLSGGDVRSNASVDEETLLTLERLNFIALLQEEKTLARIDHMLETGKPLRN